VCVDIIWERSKIVRLEYANRLSNIYAKVYVTLNE